MNWEWIKSGSKIVLSMGLFVGGIVGGILATQSNIGGAQPEMEHRISYVEERQDRIEKHRYEFEERIEKKIDRIDSKIDRIRGR